MEENKEELVVEETKEETKGEEVAPKEEPEEKEPKKVSKEKTFQKIEENRKSFYDAYNKQKKQNTWIIVIFGIAAISVFLALNKYIYIAFIIVAVLMVVLYFYSKKMKEAMEKKIQDYISEFYNLSNDFAFSNTAFHDLTFEPQTKIEEKAFTDSGFINGITHVASRNMAKGKLKEMDFQAFDCVAKIVAKNKEEVCFLGKFFTFEQAEHYDYKTLLYVPSKDPNGAGPNDLEGLEEKKELGNSHLRVWSNDPNVSRILTKKVYDALAQFEPNDCLVDVAISIKEDKIYVALSYENELMVLPLLEPFKEGPTLQYAEDLKKVAALMDVLHIKA